MKSRTKKIDEELAALARMRDEDIDTSDIKEVVDWSGAVVGKFYRPIKEPVSLRLDADVLTWFKSQGPGYQSRINELLRSAMTAGKSPEMGRSKEALCRKGPSEATETRCRTFFRYPSLERHGQLKKSREIADTIAENQCFFASVE